MNRRDLLTGVAGSVALSLLGADADPVDAPRFTEQDVGHEVVHTLTGVTAALWALGPVGASGLFVPAEHTDPSVPPDRTIGVALSRNVDIKDAGFYVIHDHIWRRASLCGCATCRNDMAEGIIWQNGPRWFRVNHQAVCRQHVLGSPCWLSGPVDRFEYHGPVRDVRAKLVERNYRPTFNLCFGPLPHEAHAWEIPSHLLQRGEWRRVSSCNAGCCCSSAVIQNMNMATEIQTAV